MPLSWPALAALVAGLMAGGCGDAPTPSPYAEAADSLQSGTRPDRLERLRRQVGRSMYFDRNLSVNRNQACVSCHNPEWGWTAPEPDVTSPNGPSEGSVPGRFGGRKAMSAAYASLAPPLHTFPRGIAQFRGGNFWDGRATGLVVDDLSPGGLSPVSDQAQRPFTNPVEMALPDEACVVRRVQQARYVDQYVRAFGPAILAIEFTVEFDPDFDIDAACENPATVPGNSLSLDGAVLAAVDREFRNIVVAIGDGFEDSPILNRFSSKYDAWRAGTAVMTDQEMEGMQLFANASTAGGASCNFCHGLPVAGVGPGGLLPQDAVFVGTDWEFDNIGVPENPINVHQSANGPDLGLGAVVAELAAEFDFEHEAILGAPEVYNGMFRVPPLRNIALQPVEGGPKVYMHNGVFTTLEEIVHWYNTSRAPAELVNCDLVTYRDDVGPYAVEDPGLNCWPDPPAVIASRRVPTFLAGNLGLTAEEEAAIVAFLKTLSDGYVPGS